MSNKDVKVEECRHYLANYYCYDEMFTNLIQINACGLTKEGYHEFHYKKCLENPNCYYKQLQRKEDENKQLREALEKIANTPKGKNSMPKTYFRDGAPIADITDCYEHEYYLKDMDFVVNIAKKALK